MANVAFNVSRIVLAVMLAVSLVLCVCMPSTFAWSSLGQSVLNELFGAAEKPEPEPVTDEGALAIRNTVVRLDGVPLDEQDLNAEFLFQVVFYTTDDSGQLVPEQRNDRTWRYATEDEDLGFGEPPSVESITTLSFHEKDNGASSARLDADIDTDERAQTDVEAMASSVSDHSVPSESADRMKVSLASAAQTEYESMSQEESDDVQGDVIQDSEAGGSGDDTTPADDTTFNAPVTDSVDLVGPVLKGDTNSENTVSLPGAVVEEETLGEGVNNANNIPIAGSALSEVLALEPLDDVNANEASEDTSEPQEVVYNIVLKHSEIAVFENLEPGLHYVAREIGVVDPALQGVYRALYDSFEGDIYENTISHADFVNVRGALGDEGNVALEKKVVRAGGDSWALTDAQKDETFTFRATMTVPTDEEGSGDTIEPLTSDSSEESSDADALSSAAGEASALADSDSEVMTISESTPDNDLVASAAGATENVTYTYRLYERNSEGNLVPVMEGDPADPYNLRQVERAITGLADDEESIIVLKSGQVVLFEGLPDGAQWSFEEVLSKAQSSVYSPDKQRLSGTVIGGVRTSALFTNVAFEETVELSGTKTWEYPATTDTDASDVATTPDSEPATTEEPSDTEPVTEEEPSVSSAKLPIETGLKTLEAEALAAIPESIVVILVDAQGKDVQTATVIPDETGAWKYTFTVPAYDVDGQLADTDAYTVRESTVTGWTPDYDDKSLDIANVYVGEKPTPDEPEPEPTPEPDDNDRVVLTPTPSGTSASTMNKTGDPMFTVVIVLLVVAAISFIISIASFIYLRRHRKKTSSDQQFKERKNTP